MNPQLEELLKQFDKDFGHDDFCFERAGRNVNEDTCRCEHYDIKNFITQAYELGQKQRTEEIINEIRKLTEYDCTAFTDKAPKHLINKEEVLNICS